MCDSFLTPVKYVKQNMKPVDLKYKDVMADILSESVFLYSNYVANGCFLT